MNNEYQKVWSKQEAEDIQRLWIESNVGLNKVQVEGRYGWFRSIPRITAKWNNVYSVNFTFFPADPAQNTKIDW